MNLSMVPPSASMQPLAADDFAARIQRSRQVGFYAKAVDRESAREIHCLVLVQEQLRGRCQSNASQFPGERRLDVIEFLEVAAWHVKGSPAKKRLPT